MSAGIPPIKIRGIRQTVPTGYFLGRISPGSGEVELINFRTAASAMIATSLVNGPGSGSAPVALLPLVNGDNPVGLILAPDGQTIGVPQ